MLTDLHSAHGRKSATLFGLGVLLSVAASPARSAPEAGENSEVKSVEVVKPASALAALTLVELRSGTLTPEAAWKRGVLSPTQMARELDKEAVYLAQTPETKRLHDALAQLLVEHGQELWKPLTETKESLPVKPNPLNPQLPTGERWLLAVGDELSRRGDARAVALFEGMLKRMEQKGLPTEERNVAALDHLAGYYKGRGELQKAVETLERGEKYSTSPHWMATVHLELARLYKQLGDTKKAGGHYAQVSTFGQERFTNMAVFDHARDVLAEGRVAEARALLKPLTAPNTKGARDVGVAALLVLSRVELQAGNLQEVQALAQQAEQMIGGNPDVEARPYLLALQEVAEEAQQWQQTPLRVEPGEVRLQVEPGRTTPLVRRLRVRTLQGVSIQVKSSDPRIQVRVLSGDGWDNASKSQVEQVVVIEIAPESLAESVKAQLTLNSPQMAGVQTRIPVLVSSENAKP